MNARLPVALRVRAEGHVEQQVVAGVREQRRVQHRVVTDVARQAHPVRARSGRPGDRRGTSALRRCAARAGAGARPMSRACGRTSGGASCTQCCSSGSWSGVGTAGGGSASSGPVGLAWNDAITISSGRSPCVTVTRRVDIDRPSRTRSTTTSSGWSGVPASTKYACRDCGSLSVTVALAATQGLGDRLPAEDPVEAPGLVANPEAVVAQRTRARAPAACRRARRGSPARGKRRSSRANG